MHEALLDVHAVVRWLVLAVLVADGGYALVRSPTGKPFVTWPFQVGAGLVDLQAAIGIALYVLGSAWQEDLFTAVLHPLAGVATVAWVHVGLRLARGRGSALEAHRTVGSAYLFALIVLAFGIPWAS